MEATNEEAPIESTYTIATCSECKVVMYQEDISMGGPIPHRNVSGSFTQFLDDAGNPMGPIWPVCDICVSSPLNKAEVQESYLKLTNSKEG